MTTPTVTISVGGVPITATTTSIPSTEETDPALYMMYVQAVKGEQRLQWIIFPPAAEALGVKAERVPAQANVCYMLARTQNHAGNRAKWFHHKLWKNDLDQTLAKHEERGFAVSGLVVSPLEADDYLKLWNEEDTPHKAIRAIDRALKPLGLQTK